jgi:drug/metabolite transporter (DMT)-like permease
MEHNNRLSPSVFAAAAVTIVLWSSSYVGTRIALHWYSPQALALLRFLTASLALGLYAGLTGIQRPRLQDLPLFLAWGFLGIFAYMWLFNQGHVTVPAATGSFLISTTPLFTALNLALFQKERLNRWGWLGMGISLAGVGLIAFAEKNGAQFNPGVVLILLAAWLLSVYNILVKPVSRRYRALEITTYAFWAGTLFMLVFTPALARELPRAPLGVTAVVIYLGIFPAAIGYALWAYALSKAPAAHVSSFMYITPVFTMLIGWVWIRELPNPYSILGGFIALAGVFLTNTKGK